MLKEAGAKRVIGELALNSLLLAACRFKYFNLISFKGIVTHGVLSGSALQVNVLIV